MSKTRGHVFLSYSREQAPFVRVVADELQQRGVDAWFAEARLQLGESWHDVFGEALGSASVVIFFVSSASLQSPSANFEIGAALGSEKLLVPIFLTKGARDNAPSFLAATGIDAYDLKPDEVADRIIEAVAERP